MKKIVLITGASRGLGRETAKKFLEDGDIVYVNYNESKEETINFCDSFDYAYPVKCDISNEDEVKKMIDKIKEEQGRLDILINNAGISDDGEITSKTKESFSKVIDVNLVGTFLVCKYTKNIMDKGVIINVSSTNGIDTYYPYSIDYDASKAGVISLTHNFAREYAPNIRVNAVAPGWINTDMNKNLSNEFKKKEEEHILLGRFAEASEIANVIFFLTTSNASYINNSVIRVDGGVKI